GPGCRWRIPPEGRLACGPRAGDRGRPWRRSLLPGRHLAGAARGAVARDPAGARRTVAGPLASRARGAVVPRRRTLEPRHRRPAPPGRPHGGDPPPAAAPEARDPVDGGPDEVRARPRPRDGPRRAALTSPSPPYFSSNFHPRP